MQLLQWYLISVVIYFIANLFLMDVFSDRIFDNGWLDDFDDSDDFDGANVYLNIFVECGVPIVRLLCLSTIIMMAFVTKEEYEKSLEEE